jgi:hypothetical protein
MSLNQIRIPVVAGLLGTFLLGGLYFALVSLAESPEHALSQAWGDRFIMGPIVLGFGIQVGLYAALKTSAFVPSSAPLKSGAMTGASGGMSATAMAACCAHHITDVLPLIGLTAASTFLAEYRMAFMVVGLGTTLIGIVVIANALIKARRSSLRALRVTT